jgi:hypothetical protein
MNGRNYEAPHCEAFSAFSSKYPPQDPVVTLNLHSSLNVRDLVSQTYSTTVNAS